MNSAIQTQIPLTSPVDHSSGALLLTLGGTLALVLLAAFLFLKAARYFGFAGAKGKNTRLISVVASAALGQKERVAIVEVNQQWLVLGVTPENVTLLSQFDKSDIGIEAKAPEQAPSFPALMASLLKNVKTGSTS